jgi:primosomal protein N' (replication factor Y)
VYLNCANYDYLKFYDKEINLRETTKFPPFARLVRILLTSENDEIVKNTTHEIMLKLKNYRVEYGKEFFFLQGMKAPVSKIKNKHRYQIVLRFSNICGDEIIDRVYKLLDEYKNSKISIFVENNPQSLS